MPTTKATQQKQLEQFIGRLNAEPAPASIEATADGNAQTVVISHVEMTLDELFNGLWSTENFTWQSCGNGGVELSASLQLVVTHPVTNQLMKRVGVASIFIDYRTPMTMAFPTLKAECLKNAAKSLGKIFGRDLNRSNVSTYKPGSPEAKADANARSKKAINDKIRKVRLP